MMMAKVFLHTKNSEEIDGVNEDREFARIPVEGEYLALSSLSDWYKVRLVVHTPFKCPYNAEVYAVKVDRRKIMAESWNKKSFYMK